MWSEEAQFATGQIVDAVKHKDKFRGVVIPSSAAIFGQARDAASTYYVLGGYSNG
jgi:hypothetical protein